MWPQLFLPCAVLYAFQTLHMIVNPLVAKYREGNQWKPKDVTDLWIQHYYHRDYTRSLDPMRPWGVETIPDMPPKIIDLD